MSITDLKKLSKEEFLALPNMTEELYTALHKSKQGWISISRETDGKGDEGYTDAFGEGLSCHVSNPHRWYYTSVIQKIDWDNKVFTTLNSRYKFNFIEHFETDYDDSNN